MVAKNVYLKKGIRTFKVGEIMNTKQVQIDSVEEAIILAKRLSTFLKPSDVITLEGELGSGKTVFAKGIASGLNVEQLVTSPTFTIVKEYEGKYPFYHMDAYRLEYSDEDIGFSDYFNGDGISVVEWAQFIEEYLPADRLDIIIEYINEDARKITFHPHGSHFVQILTELF